MIGECENLTKRDYVNWGRYDDATSKRRFLQ